ncbi:hypothetical protein HanXRQr2_Chr08g0332651 [Helianthus annuus]|nr:hypothetical protein HanXRQr2_Chr11g0476821 [Helianthus annuus]KAF5794838.1 hypothetical protein HanXRQr2_Chr08g0332651 [Helianthus annuus]KAJ0874058.1 hypothetical protein HanPSC8_Chr11g0459671 [Helianthus annuus]
MRSCCNGFVSCSKHQIEIACSQFTQSWLHCSSYGIRDHRKLLCHLGCTTSIYYYPQSASVVYRR